MFENSVEDKDRNYDQDVTGGLGELQDEKLSQSTLFVIHYFDRLKGYVTTEKGTRGENHKY
jgi:hypothetical protein